MFAELSHPHPGSSHCPGSFNTPVPQQIKIHNYLRFQNRSHRILWSSTHECMIVTIDVFMKNFSGVVCV